MPIFFSCVSYAVTLTPSLGYPQTGKLEVTLQGLHPISCPLNLPSSLDVPHWDLLQVSSSLVCSLAVEANSVFSSNPQH